MKYIAGFNPFFSTAAMTADAASRKGAGKLWESSNRYHAPGGISGWLSVADAAKQADAIAKPMQIPRAWSFMVYGER
jgi:hypothetical protein